MSDTYRRYRAIKDALMQRFRRWCANEAMTLDTYFLPVAEAVLTNLAQQPLVLIMDGSTVGRGCSALLLRVVSHGRALPLAWTVVHGAKGHFPTTAHLALLAQVHDLVPEDATVTFLGDGEFDGTELQATLTSYGWAYVCRTAQ